jgi:hypothetical protein
MAYNLTTGSGNIITIADGTIDTTSTTLALPGRNYSGYGQPVDQDLIRLLEHFASSSVPTKPLAGQLWFDTTTSPGILKLCPADNTPATGWLNLLTNPVNSDLIVNGNIAASKNITAAGNITIGGVINGTLNNGLQFVSTGTGGTAPLTYNASATQTVSYNTIGAAKAATQGTTANTVAYAAAGIDNGSDTRGLNPTTGSIYGSWGLAAGATLNATYADLAERFESDEPYDAGTVVELGGEREITAVREELSDRVFGVVSKTAAFLMNGAAGGDTTHPAVAVGGRVPVKVIGTVRKGDRLVSAGHGYARAARIDEARAFNTIGRALKNKDTDGLGTVEAFVSIK